MENNIEFQSFRSLERFEQPVIITEKIDGTNAQIVISEHMPEEEGAPPFFNVRAASRNRWITPEDDNYDFAAWVKQHEQLLIETLGVGRHFGEWYGSGIGRNYGLKERYLALFNTNRWGLIHESKRTQEFLDAGIRVVPTLHNESYKEGMIASAMDNLQAGGSIAIPGFMQPEGIVIYWRRHDIMMKKVFPEIKLAKPKKESTITQVEWDQADALLTIERLNSVLSKDERYSLEYPRSLPELAKLYIEDLVKESHEPINEVVLKMVKRRVFNFIKEIMEEKNEANSL